MTGRVIHVKHGEKERGSDFPNEASRVVAAGVQGKNLVTNTVH